MGILIFFVLLVAVSLTVYVAQQQQQIRQRASADDCTNIANIENCPPETTAGNTCTKQDFKCKIGSTIYECKKRME